MKRIFIDPAKCDGCKSCTLACMASHQDMAPRQGSLTELRQAIYALDLTDPATQSRNRIVSDGEGGYRPLFCRHCDIPDCAGACMSGALQKNMETGLVEYNADKCAACYMCVMPLRCARHLPRPEADGEMRLLPASGGGPRLRPGLPQEGD